MQRLDRELSPDRARGSPTKQFDDEGKPIESKPAETKITTEQMIHDLTLDLEDEQDRLDTLKNETLPGSCKS